MVAIPFGLAAYRRRAGNLPEFKLENMFVERTPSDEEGVALLSRPGLLASSTAGNGPVTGVFCEEGTFGGAVFVVSGGKLYKDGAELGTIAGTGPVSFASSNDDDAASELLVTAGTKLYSYNGTDLAEVALPDDFDCAAITFVSGHFVAVRAGTHKFYWSAVLDGRTWDALHFASAESEPDALIDCKAVRGDLYLIGQATIEPWAYTGGLDLAFEIIQHQLYTKGAHSTGCAVEADNALHWVGSDGIVYRGADVPQRLSDHGIEERIAASDSVSLFTFIHEGHTFVCVRLDEGTFPLDVSTGQWCEFTSYGRDNFRAQCAITSGTITYLGDDESGTVWTLDSSRFKDGDDPITGLFTMAFPIKGGTVTVDSLRVDASVGHTALLEGQGSDPVMEVRTSRDAGNTFGNWRSAALGAQGDYRTRTIVRRLGTYDYPGFMAEGRITDPVPRRISGVYINEPGGGRSR